jgi:hypothetical protein
MKQDVIPMKSELNMILFHITRKILEALSSLKKHRVLFLDVKGLAAGNTKKWKSVY